MEAASERSTTWNGSNSFFAAEMAIAVPALAGGAASLKTLSMVVVVQRVAPAGEGSAYVMSPVGVQSVHVRVAPVPARLPEFEPEHPPPIAVNAKSVAR